MGGAHRTKWLRGDEVLALNKRRGVVPLSHLLDADSEAGHARFEAHVNARPYPRFERDEQDPTLFVRIDEDGTRARGRLVERAFDPLPA
jgi:hypothetical protein